MKSRFIGVATLLAVWALLSGPRQADAQLTCRVLSPTACFGLSQGVITSNPVIVVGNFPTPAAALTGAINFLDAVATITYTDSGLPIFQSEFVRQCLVQEVRELRALTNATTGRVDAANLAQFCQELAALRARLTTLRRDGRLNNCFLRLTCGLNANGTLAYCNENNRICATGYLDRFLLCAAVLADCTGPSPQFKDSPVDM